MFLYEYFHPTKITFWPQGFILGTYYSASEKLLAHNLYG